MAKKEKDLKQEKPTEEATKDTENTEKTTEKPTEEATKDTENTEKTTEKPTKETKKCARCGAELVEDKEECTVCLAPVNWER